MPYADLKALHRKLRDDIHPNLSLRVHRALSWLHKAEQCDDKDSHFIYLWIGFNAVYATDIDAQYRKNERETFKSFFQKLVELDKKNELYDIIWSEFSTSVRSLLDNKYVFQPFWDFQNGNTSEKQWQSSFTSAKSAANKALSIRDTVTILSIIFDRIYTLRNQVFHGGATWNSKVNRKQVFDGINILHQTLLIVITIMLNNPNTLWGDPYYPVVE